MIYDCFMMYNELEMLDIRLNLLNNYVDYFVVSESKYTHSGKEKPLYFKENKDKYSKFLDKIIYIEFENAKQFGEIKEKDLQFAYNGIPIGEYDYEQLYDEKLKLAYKYWYNEQNQRADIIRALKKCSDNDIILISDIDEIPNFEVILKKFNNNLSLIDTIWYCVQDIYYYYFNNKLNTIWQGTYITKYKFIKNNKINYFRYFRAPNLIKNCGWHFSYIGDHNKAKQKLESFVHQEFNSIDISDLENHIKNGTDFLHRFENKITLENIPKYIIDNYKNYFFN